MRQAVIAAMVLLAAAVPLAAAPAAYVLDLGASTVRFEADIGSDHIRGRMPVTRADLTLDFDRVANSTITVTLDAAQAETNLPFAAEAMKAPTVLDVRAHPAITFVSTRVRAEGGGARVEGQLTIRGVTRPVILSAQVYRQEGRAAGDRSHLAIRLTGKVQRSAFGATGWAAVVGDEVRLDILARIARVE